MKTASLWMVIGFTGQALFFSRVLVQWLTSERLGRSVVPTAYWVLSLGGGILLLLYALARRDPVFIAGQSLGFIVYSRNLWLITHPRDAAAQLPGTQQLGTEQPRGDRQSGAAEDGDDR